MDDHPQVVTLAYRYVNVACAYSTKDLLVFIEVSLSNDFEREELLVSGMRYVLIMP